MKEIKFRAEFDGDIWDVEEIDFLCGYVTLCKHGTDNVQKVSIYLVELYQYIGLKDKNNKEIYDGNNLQDEFGNVARVEWNKDIGAWSWKYGISWGMIESDVLEIIDNGGW